MIAVRPFCGSITLLANKCVHKTGKMMKKTTILAATLGLSLAGAVAQASTLVVHSDLPKAAIRAYQGKKHKQLSFTFRSVSQSSNGGSRYEWRWAPAVGKDSLTLVYPTSVRAIRLVSIGQDPVTVNHDLHAGTAKITAVALPGGHGSMSLQQQ
jgi:hypothetical protein